MIYPYLCKCGTEFDVTKTIHQIDLVEECPSCHSIAERIIASGSFYGEKDEDASYDPALGCIVKNQIHRRKIAKDRGLIEVGNEDMNKWYDNKTKEKENERAKWYDDFATERFDVRTKK